MRMQFAWKKKRGLLEVSPQSIVSLDRRRLLMVHLPPGVAGVGEWEQKKKGWGRRTSCLIRRRVYSLWVQYGTIGHYAVIISLKAASLRCEWRRLARMRNWSIRKRCASARFASGGRTSVRTVNWVKVRCAAVVRVQLQFANSGKWQEISEKRGRFRGWKRLRVQDRGRER